MNEMDNIIDMVINYFNEVGEKLIESRKTGIADIDMNPNYAFYMRNIFMNIPIGNAIVKDCSNRDNRTLVIAQKLFNLGECPTRINASKYINKVYKMLCEHSSEKQKELYPYMPYHEFIIKQADKLNCKIK